MKLMEHCGCGCYVQVEDSDSIAVRNEVHAWAAKHLIDGCRTGPRASASNQRDASSTAGGQFSFGFNRVTRDRFDATRQ